MVGESKKVILKDSTLREGLDTPNVKFTLEEKWKIAKLLDKANVPEIEIVAPSHVLRDLEFVKRLKGEGLKIRTSGLVYAYKRDCESEIEEGSRCLDRLDILMPVTRLKGVPASSALTSSSNVASPSPITTMSTRGLASVSSGSKLG